MSIAGIEKVREAETKAAQIKKTSEEAAAQIIADGKKEAKAEESYQKKIDSEAVLCEQLKASARENLMQAASAIVGKVVGTYGND